MIEDAIGYIESATDTALSLLAPTVCTAYPPTVFADGTALELPIIVYTVETATADVRARRDSRVRCTVDIDIFHRSRAEAGRTAAQARRAMLEVMARCDMDRYSAGAARGLWRRSMRLSGYLDLYTGVVYAN